MINKINIKTAREILGKEINNNKNLVGKKDFKFQQLCMSAGELDLLLDKMKKEEKNNVHICELSLLNEN